MFLYAEGGTQIAVPVLLLKRCVLKSSPHGTIFCLSPARDHLPKNSRVRRTSSVNLAVFSIRIKTIRVKFGSTTTDEAP